MDEQQQGQVMAPALVAPGSAVVELLGRDGRATLVQRVTQWPVRIGRSPACDIVLDDVHLAAEHAELHLAPDGGVRLKLLESRNGGHLGKQRLTSGDDVPLPMGGAFQLAGCTLRLRTSADTLAPEHLLIVDKTRHWALVPLLLLVMLFFQWVDRWSAVDPDARWVDYASPLLAPLAFVLAWAGLWSLASQLFRHRFPFTTHLRRVLVVIVVLQGLDWTLPAIAYAFSWPRLMALESLATPVGTAVLIAWHARLVWPGTRRILNGGIAALLLLGLGLQVGNRQEQQYVFGPPYLASLPPPVLRIAGTRPPEALIESLKPLKAELARQARKDNEGFEGDEAGGE
ncbi:FHA domain-containing protein [Roseateles sp.]|uniref:FHA domain-containing protein n=1 Tax=Roseateles sp. TaxID=1971397 RepID=UPI0025D39E64|nr:FHA domain-containing protein [Roseateles sp.]MBV8035055.1 FHA domain-containing protein [Roseateles sp.]